MILGIWDGHDAGACLVDAVGGILCAVNEERFTRRKLEVGFPTLSIRACLDEAGISASEVTHVAASTYDVAKTIARYVPATRERYYRKRRRQVPPGPLYGVSKILKYVVTSWKPNPLTRLLSERALKRELGRHGFRTAALTLVPHHLAHAASAAFTSGFETALVATLDGVGDGLAGTLSRLRDGRLELLCEIPARDSLGIFYEHVTNLLNMRELEDEGKVMALATYGYPPADGVNSLDDLFEVDGLTLRCRLGSLALRRHLARQLFTVPSEQFAWMAQDVLESKTVELLRSALATTGLRKIAYAGGVASNIKTNLALRNLEGCEEIFVFPHMGDGGLALGAALSCAVKQNPGSSYALGDLRLGPSVGDDSIERALRASGLCYERRPAVERDVAARLEKEEIVLWFQDRMEFGPRALGGRSILARPDRPALRDRLNLKLKRRVWYQPFCPSLLDDEAPGLLEDPVPNRYMTMAYRVRPEATHKLAGVIGRDGTCRPQMVSAADGRFHRLLSELRTTIGVGAVLNTSFNVHGEPMVASPEDAIRTFVACGADALVMNDFLVERGGQC